MPESQQHIDLVNNIVHHIKSKYSNRNLFILSDLPEEYDNRPPQIQNHIPDVFAQNPINSFTIIGEAKTTNDIESDHTLKQLKEFVNYLTYQPENSSLLLSVPSEGVYSAKQLLNSLRSERTQSVKLLVLDEIGVVI